MPAITLTDAATGSTAQILPELGCNCFSFRPAIGGEAIEALWAEPGFAPGHRPSRSGIPILFPFAGRLRGQTFRYDGRDYALADVQLNGPNAIHGFVFNRPWRVLRQEDDRIEATFQASVDDPALLAQWPADFRITAEYRVTGTSLAATYTVENPDQRPLPFGFGTHPYFRLPLGGAVDDCLVQVPASWVAILQDALPTGAAVSVDAARDLRSGRRYGDFQLDDVLTGLAAEHGRVATSVTDPSSGRTLTQTFDAAAFPYVVAFTAAHREAVCLEPYTTLPNAFELLAQGRDPNLLVLPPGGTWSTRIEMTLS